MKKNNDGEWLLTILLIICTSIATICNTFVYINQPKVHNLVQLIVSATCLVIYVVFLIFQCLQVSKKYIIIYDDFFELYGKSIFCAPLIRKRKNRRYVKQGAIGTTEKICLFSHNNFTIKFGLIEIDNYRKLMIVYKMTSVPDDFLKVFEQSIEKAKEHYFNYHEIVPLESNDYAYNNNTVNLAIINVIYKDNTIAFTIVEDDGCFIVKRYEYYIPMEIYNRFFILHSANWFEEDVEYGTEPSFDTLEEANEFVRRQCN